MKAPGADTQKAPPPGNPDDPETIHRLVRGDPRWPDGLASIDVEPAQLWLRGRPGLLGAERKVAIVGSRAPTPYGQSQARRFGETLARHGVCVVSGMARGVDAAAHEGALRAGGATIAVLGCGVDRPWPTGPLGQQLASEGLLVSEFPPGSGPRRHHFPLRNRIIAALCDAVLVIEAAGASGSLITARWAADQGQDVFALPGRVDHPMAEGTLKLVREGATPVGSPGMLLDDLYGTLFEDGAAPVRPGADPSMAPMTEAHGKLLAALQGETLSASEISHNTSMPVGEVLAGLTELALAGRVTRAPGGLWVR